MKKTEIIKMNYEFKYFFKKGEYISGNYIEIFYHNNKNGVNKLGVVVGKKSGNSVVRHRIRRLIIESYSNLEDRMIDNTNLLICWKKNAVYNKDISFFNVKEDLEKVLRKANLLDD